MGFWQTLAGLVFPAQPRCVLCGAPYPGRHSGLLCARCRAAITLIQPPFCRRCGKPMEDREGELCGDCLHTSHAFAFARAVGVYEGELKEWIHRFKYRKERELVRPLAGLCMEKMAAERRQWQVDCIVPVPLHPDKLRERGFNQAALLARAVGQGLGIRVVDDSLVRRQATLPQNKLSRTARFSNLAGAFAVEGLDGFAGQRVLLLDDVLTTGATADACARALRRAGAREVVVLTLARGKSR